MDQRNLMYSTKLCTDFEEGLEAGDQQRMEIQGQVVMHLLLLDNLVTTAFKDKKNI